MALTVKKISPVVILVHGAVHRAEIYGKVVDLLQDAGHDASSVVALQLPSTGNVLANRVPDINAVRKITGKAFMAGRDVMLVGHSYGATVISEAAQHFRNTTGPRILGLIFLAGFIPLISEVRNPSSKPDLQAIAPPWMNLDKTCTKITWDGDMMNFPPQRTFYNALSSKEADYWTTRLEFSSYAALTDNSTYIPYTGDFKCVYVLCEQDNCITPPWAEAFINQPGAKFTVKKLDADHSPMLSKPEEVVQIIRAVAEENSRC